MTKRREALAVLLGSALVSPLMAIAQRQGSSWRIGFLSAAPLSSITARTEALRQGLRDLGYTEGQNLVVEWRSADDKWERLPELTAELIDLKVAVIVTAEGPATVAARKTTSTVPIVMGQSGDPVAMGVVASLAHPGGNVTGLTTLSTDLPSKQTELLKEVLPKLKRIAVLSNPANPLSAAMRRRLERTAKALGLQLIAVDARSPQDFTGAFAAMGKAHSGGLLVLPDPMFLSERTQIAQLAAKHMLPAIYGIPEHAEAGGFMAYAASRTESFRRAAIYIDKILRGAKAAELPVEQPTNFEFIINLKAAKTLGVKIPQSILLRADKVIE
jgi:putative ABC transport system substrate-binding protein